MHRRRLNRPRAYTDTESDEIIAYRLKDNSRYLLDLRNKMYLLFR